MFHLPEPFQFNPLKHHLSYIREYISGKLAHDRTFDEQAMLKEIRHIGTSVMDIYSGSMSIDDILSEIKNSLESQKLDSEKSFEKWAGNSFSDYRILTLPDTSQWALKYHNDKTRFVHLFPARFSPHSFRAKANTLKSAILYNIIIGKDYISRKDLNHARSLLGLSPVKDPSETEAITEMIEIIRL